MNLKSKPGWFRISIAAVVFWFGISHFIVSTNYRLYWWKGSLGQYGNFRFGDGFYMFIIGALVITVVLNSIPWILDGFSDD